MRNTKLSRAEELARISQEESELFLEEKLNAKTERTAHMANLKKLRLEQEAKRKRAALKLVKAVQRK